MISWDIAVVNSTMSIKNSRGTNIGFSGSCGRLEGAEVTASCGLENGPNSDRACLYYAICKGLSLILLFTNRRLSFVLLLLNI